MGEIQTSSIPLRVLEREGPMLVPLAVWRRACLDLQWNGHSKLGSLQALHWVKVNPGTIMVQDIQQRTELPIQHVWLSVVSQLPFDVQKQDRFSHLPLRIVGWVAQDGPSLRWRPVHICRLVIQWEQELLWHFVIQTVGGLCIIFFLLNIFSMSSSQWFRDHCAPFLPWICLSRSTSVPPSSCPIAIPEEGENLKAPSDSHSQHWQFFKEMCK